MTGSRPIDPGILTVLREEIMHGLERDAPGQPDSGSLEADPLRSRIILVFDREGYWPCFFAEMKTRRIAILSYRKFPGEPWPQSEFRTHKSHPWFLRRETDFVAFVYRFARDRVIGEMDCVYSHWTTRHRDGFGDADLTALRRLVPSLALAIKCASLARIAATLVEVYLGRDAGQRVLSGRISRGVAERINIQPLRTQPRRTRSSLY